jgi:Flp pilus assembly pilin Flp
MFALVAWIKTLASRAAIEERGQAMVEYAVILAIISVAAIGVMALLGPEITGAFQSVYDCVTGAPAC